MTIILPDDLESRLQAAVHSGRFASVDAAIVEAARLLFRELDRGQQEQVKTPRQATEPGIDPLLGSMHEAADELDEIVTDAYRKRRDESWRDIAVE
jgi:Arc/MetJ-type ribon-helix-helix transcriptional regulator